MLTINNFLKDIDSNYFINFHKNNFNLNNCFSFLHRKTECIEWNNISKHSQIIKLYKKHKFFIERNYHNLEVNYFQIVKWPKGEKQKVHLDFDYHPLTSIIYLNDDFEGGETKVGENVIKPKKNKLIAFSGNKIKHEVFEITNGIRYTITCWYKNKRK